MPKAPIYILGISCYYHDSAAVLLKDGEIIFAAQEERFTRVKHDSAFPKKTIEHILKYANITIDDIKAIGFYEKPFLKFFDRILRTAIKMWPRGYRQFLMAMQEWLTKKLWFPNTLKKELGYAGDIFYILHHESHAASAYYCSGFSEAAIVTVDGVGEWATTTISKGEGSEITLKKEIHYPHSLGLLYSAITYYLGFTVNSAEYKVMGLAPYGEPKYKDKIYELIDVKDDGSFALNMRYFTFEYGLTMTGKALERLLGQPRRKPETELTQFHKDIARSVQEVTEEVMLKIVKYAKAICPSDNLCLAGGVALNCVANGKILRIRLFKDIFIQPAAGDAGGALGVALAIWHRLCATSASVETPERASQRKTIYKTGNRMEHVFLGTEYTKDAIEILLKQEKLPYQYLSDKELIDTVAKLLGGDSVIGWFQGRMEYGPRSLGNRSILADARNQANWQKVNLKIKFRESFRPFAPVVLEERVTDYFDLDRESPFMLLVADVHEGKRTEIPAVTHVDGSARIQTIRHDQNPRFYNLLKAFEKHTGCPVLINTSFNVRGEPIVESPQDALHCFLNTDMDYLAMGNFLLLKEQMPREILKKREEYLGQFALD